MNNYTQDPHAPTWWINNTNNSIEIYNTEEYFTFDKNSIEVIELYRKGRLKQIKYNIR